MKVVKAAPSKAERKRLKAIRDRYQREKPTLEELTASGEFTEPVSQEEFWQIAEAGRALKEAREKARVTLATVAKRSGIDQAALSRLENGIYDNPTIATLSRYARALGKDLVFKLADADLPSP
ncbi:MAG TPA: helix-turn-helix transcriptional regulator [Pirellulales bacterium]|nr:helix-turn-helix transcriptional regulator [Pirellulales bacterium]